MSRKLFYCVLRRLLMGALALLLLLLIGDGLYAGITAWRYRVWSKALVRDDNGVRGGCAEYAMGQGSVGLLLVHGFGDSPRVYRQLAADLAGLGFHCEAVRFPGFGESMDAYKNSRRGDWSRAVEQGLSRMRTQGYERIYVAGHSMGAAVCLSLAQNNRLPADGLILLAPLLEVSAQRSPVLTPEQWFVFAEHVLPLSTMVENVFGLELASAQEPEDDGRDRFIPRTVYRELFQLCREVENGSRTVPMPVMLVTAEQDKVIDNASAKQVVRSLSVPSLTELHLEHSAHAIPLDGERELVAEAIRDFTSECLR